MNVSINIFLYWLLFNLRGHAIGEPYGKIKTTQQ